jgi:hypothetical protein
VGMPVASMPVVSMEVRPLPGEEPALVHQRCVRAIARICRGAGLRRAPARDESGQPVGPGTDSEAGMGSEAGQAAALQPSEAPA